MNQPKTNGSPSNTKFDSNYVQWKHWGASSFGEIGKSAVTYYNAEMARAVPQGTSPLRVLEIGFGNGQFLAYAKRRGWSVCGIEANDELVQIAREKGFEVSHGTDLGAFAHTKFDLIVAFDVLEHIPQHALDRLIADVSSMLVEGGTFLARFPNGDSPFGLPIQNGDTTHVTSIGKWKASQMANNSGLELIFSGGEAKPIFGVSLVHTLHRIAVWPIKALINGFVNWILFPGVGLAFCSPNMVVVWRSGRASH